jgi:hypothetical protein
MSAQPIIIMVFALQWKNNYNYMLKQLAIAKG